MRYANALVPPDEWECFLFPIKLVKLKFENDLQALPGDTTVEIWRDDNYRLAGKMYGADFYHKTESRVSYVGDTDIVVNENLVGYDIDDNKWTIINCLVGNLDKVPLANSVTSNQSASLIFDFLKFNSRHAKKDPIKAKRLDWFLTGKIDIFFERSTFRKEKPRIKIRSTEVQYKNRDYSPPYSISRDCAVLNSHIGQCIVALVPPMYLPQGFQGICFEFNDKSIASVTPDEITALKHFVSFLIGTKLSYVGYSILQEDEVVECLFVSPHLHYNVRGGQPPVPSTFHHEWGRFEYLINMLFPKYLELEKPLQLGQAISRYWTAQHVSIGINLPILANALEVLVANYLKMSSTKDLTYMDEKDYMNVLGDEFEKIKARLLKIEDGEIIIKKILGDFRKGPSEKMQNFYSRLELKLGKDEKKALSLRNNMAHGAPDYSDLKRAHEHLNLSHIYEMLFNRTVLRLLGYEDFYRDYSQKGQPVKHIKLPSGFK